MKAKTGVFALFVIAALASAVTSRAQLRVKDLNDQVTPQKMVDSLLGGGVTAFNVQYTGSNNAAGVFCSGNGVIGPTNGIILTSGSASDVIGTNDSSGTTTDNGLPGDPDLDSLIPTFQTLDASVLEFDFIPVGSEVRFNYVFGSEEYNEFVDSPFNDVFGFFVNGINYALIPSTATPVSINNVNNGFHASGGLATGPCMNCQFFIDNTGSPAARNTQLDGLTVVLPMTAPVIAGAVNHMKIAIADAGDHALDSAVFIEAGSLRSGAINSNCVTRDARFWFTHPDSTDAACVTLKSALQRALNESCDTFDLGFIMLPTLPRYNNTTDPVQITLIESLGLYWRKRSLTGEPGGTQNSGLPSSPLCRARKRVVGELIAAIANTTLFQTDPAGCGFPADLISQARTVAGAGDIRAARAMTTLLRQFNSSGVTNQLPEGFVECSEVKKSVARRLGRDPATQINCGLNFSCESAEPIIFPSSSDPFAKAVFTRTLSLAGSSFLNATNLIPDSPCITGASNIVANVPGAVWSISPDVAGTNRHFSVSTSGSNFDTVSSVWRGTCGNVVVGATQTLQSVTCSINMISSIQTPLTFTTDGTEAYFIIIQGFNGEFGSIKLRVTSP